MRGSKRRALKYLVFLVMLVSWELIARVAPWPSYLFPPPSVVAGSLLRLLANGSLAAASGKSLLRLSEGYLVSVLVGVPLGLLAARDGLLSQTVKPLMMGLQALPSICWLPLAILWFGLSEMAIL